MVLHKPVYILCVEKNWILLTFLNMFIVQLLFGFYDPCHLKTNPGWPLRNFLTFICLRWKLQKVRFFCYRERLGLANLEVSLIGDALISIQKGRVALCNICYLLVGCFS